MAIWGYIRVSTRDQNEERQVIALTNFGVEKQNIFIDKQSGKDFNRTQYKRMLRKLKLNDTIVIKSIDRLGRNYAEILEQWRHITKDIKADIIVLDMPLLNTQTNKDLTGTLISDIVLQLLSYVAQTERELIRQRQAEGIKAAKARGVKFGRSPKAIPEEFYVVYQEWKSGKISARKASLSLGVAHKTFLKWAHNETCKSSTDSNSK